MSVSLAVFFVLVAVIAFEFVVWTWRFRDKRVYKQP